MGSFSGLEGTKADNSSFSDSGSFLSPSSHRAATLACSASSSLLSIQKLPQQQRTIGPICDLMFKSSALGPIPNLNDSNGSFAVEDFHDEDDGDSSDAGSIVVDTDHVKGHT